MFKKADITYKQVENYDYWCDTGHYTKKTFKRNGQEEEKIKFFKVISNNLCGIYCEPCLIVANYMIRQKRKVK